MSFIIGYLIGIPLGLVIYIIGSWIKDKLTMKFGKVNPNIITAMSTEIFPIIEVHAKSNHLSNPPTTKSK